MDGAIDKKLKSKIKKKIEESIKKFFENKKVRVKHVLDKIFPVERRVRSLIGGLETSLGTTVWEPIAKLLAKENGFIIKEEGLLMPKPFLLNTDVADLKKLREDKQTKISMVECVKQLRGKAKNINRANLSYEKPPPGKGIDLYLIKNGTEYVFDIKTNQINQGDGLKLNLQLLEWYAYKLTEDPDAQIEARIAFPFNPYKGDWWEHNGSRAYPLEKGKDAWVENEFWDFCSGQKNTWAEILNLFDELGKENFGQQFSDVLHSEKSSD